MSPPPRQTLLQLVAGGSAARAEGGAAAEQEVWENQARVAQRWSSPAASSGWLAFSDRSGRVRLASPDAAGVPAGWQGNEFAVDCSSTSSGRCDAQGWSYGSSAASLDAELAQGLSAGADRPRANVRRRRWARALTRCEEAAGEPPAGADDSKLPLLQGWLGVKTQTKGGLASEWHSRFCSVWTPQPLAPGFALALAQPSPAQDAGAVSLGRSSTSSDETEGAVVGSSAGSGGSSSLVPRPSLIRGLSSASVDSTEASAGCGGLHGLFLSQRSGTVEALTRCALDKRLWGEQCASVHIPSLRCFALGKDCLVDDTVASSLHPGHFALHSSSASGQRRTLVLNAGSEALRLRWVAACRRVLQESAALRLRSPQSTQRSGSSLASISRRLSSAVQPPAPPAQVQAPVQQAPAPAPTQMQAQAQAQANLAQPHAQTQAQTQQAQASGDTRPSRSQQLLDLARSITDKAASISDKASPRLRRSSTSSARERKRRAALERERSGDMLTSAEAWLASPSAQLSPGHEPSGSALSPRASSLSGKLNNLFQASAAKPGQHGGTGEKQEKALSASFDTSPLAFSPFSTPNSSPLVSRRVASPDVTPIEAKEATPEPAATGRPGSDSESVTTLLPGGYRSGSGSSEGDADRLRDAQSRVGAQALELEVVVIKGDSGLGVCLERCGDGGGAPPLAVARLLDPAAHVSQVLRVGDRLASINGRQVRSEADAIEATCEIPVGSEVRLAVVRQVPRVQLVRSSSSEQSASWWAAAASGQGDMQRKMADIYELFDREISLLLCRCGDSATYRDIQAYLCRLLGAGPSEAGSQAWRVWFRDWLDAYFLAKANRYRVYGVDPATMSSCVVVVE